MHLRIDEISEQFPCTIPPSSITIVSSVWRERAIINNSQPKNNDTIRFIHFYYERQSHLNSSNNVEKPYSFMWLVLSYVEITAFVAIEYIKRNL